MRAARHLGRDFKLLRQKGGAVPAADLTAPTLSAPVGTSTGSTTATIGATTNEANGRMYGVVTTSSTAPSAVQIENGQNHLGAVAVFAGSVSVGSTGAKTISATGLATTTNYYAHMMHKDAAGNRSNVVSSVAFSDLGAPTLSIQSAAGTSPVKWRVAGTTDIGAYAEIEVVYGVLNASDAIFAAGAGGIGSNGVTNFQPYEVLMQGPEWETGDSAIAGFVEPPAGTAYTARSRYRTNPYDSANSTDSAWSNKISDTMALAARWDSATSARFFASMAFSNSDKTATTSSGGNVFVAANIAAAGADFEFEVTFGGSPSELYIGVTDGSDDFSASRSGSQYPGSASAPNNTHSTGAHLWDPTGGTSYEWCYNGTAPIISSPLPGVLTPGAPLSVHVKTSGAAGTHYLKIFRANGTQVVDRTGLTLTGKTIAVAGFKVTGSHSVTITPSAPYSDAGVTGTEVAYA